MPNEVKEKNDKEKIVVPGYPEYPPEDDIYNNAIEESDIDPSDLLKNKTPNEKVGTWNEMNFEENSSGDDLDVPGSELDDVQESIGNEDEENNYYSIGGDDHNDLEEDRS
ncbi:MAG: hypothetical protein CFE21_10715 [Bacteroidetes bacterium B1(2017)]|nr:MAG: hypothetical protein CFE21_10715 [Bacteroidetes bacterium B1(2017)]